ncbi:MAG: hypothetical protein AB7G15_11260 [Alphaproteobacteria bacterium]
MIILRLTIVLATILGMVVGSGTGTFAQRTRADLDAVTAELQKKPGDAALRERAIKIAAALNPPPAVPEDATRWFVRGNTALEDAKGAADYDRAIGNYATALRIAPWFADAYFNQAKAYELRQRYADAIASLRWYLLAAPNAADARTAQNKIYALEEKAEAAKRAPPPAAKPVQPAKTTTVAPPRSLVTIEGTWRANVNTPSEPVYQIVTIARSGTQYTLIVESPGRYRNGPFLPISANDTELKIRSDHPNDPYTGKLHDICIYRLTTAGQMLEMSCDQYKNEMNFNLKWNRTYSRAQ